MLDVAIRKADGSTAVDWQHVGVRTAPPLPVAPALAPLLPGGLRRGSTVSVSGSLSLLLALLGAASADGAWCALVGFPRISAEAADEYGIDLRPARPRPAPPGGPARVDDGGRRPARRRRHRRRPAAARPGGSACRRPTSAGWPPAPAARTRCSSRTSPTSWPGADVRLQAREGVWSGIGAGTGRLRARQLEVHASGRGQSARPRSASLWLPADGGGARPDVAGTAPLAPVIDLAG